MPTSYQHLNTINDTRRGAYHNMEADLTIEMSQLKFELDQSVLIP